MRKKIVGIILIALFFACNKDEVVPIVSHQINPIFSSVTDQEGNQYQTVILGGQEWLTENLRTSLYCNGDSIPNIINNNQWTESESGAWAYYDNDSTNNLPHGKLYNWYAVGDERNICPCGWHVPTYDDWYDLIVYLNGFTVAGGKLKSTGTNYWKEPNFAATNESGFSALPSKSRSYDDGTFFYTDEFASFWGNNYNYFGSVPLSSICYLEFDRGSVKLLNNPVSAGLPVRCVKD
jgi:uncharacterized protein (TIGR02145 family)